MFIYQNSIYHFSVKGKTHFLSFSIVSYSYSSFSYTVVSSFSIVSSQICFVYLSRYTLIVRFSFVCVKAGVTTLKVHYVFVLHSSECVCVYAHMGLCNLHGEDPTGSHVNFDGNFSQHAHQIHFQPFVDAKYS